MPHLTPFEKHIILKSYTNHPTHATLSSIARDFCISGGASTIKKWLNQWNGTVQSLQRKSGSGRPKLLTSTQVKDYITQPIRNKNRSYKTVHYTELQSSIQHKTGKEVSLRSIQRYGKQELAIKHKQTKKRTADERNHIHHITMPTHLSVRLIL